MKTAKIHVLALVVSLSALGIVAVSGDAWAQCVPDTPTGPSMHACNDLMRATPPQAQPARTVMAVPVGDFLRNPLVVTASWIAARPSQGGFGRAALEQRGVRNGYREARAPRRYTW